MPATPPDLTADLPPAALAAVTALRDAFDEKVRRLRGWTVAIAVCNVVLAVLLLWTASRDPAGTAVTAATSAAAEVARAEAAKALARHDAYVEQVFRSVQDRAAATLAELGVLRERVDGAHRQAAAANAEAEAARERTAGLHTAVRELDGERNALQAQLTTMGASARKHADDLATLTGAFAALRSSETGQLAQHVQALAQLVEEHGSLADVQTLAAAVRAGTFARVDCRALTVRRADGSVLAELRDDGLTFRDAQANDLGAVHVRDDHVRVRLGREGSGARCDVAPDGVTFRHAKEGTGDRAPAAFLGLHGPGGRLALADFGSDRPEPLVRRVSLDGRELLLSDAGAPVVRVGREPDGNGSVRVSGPMSETGQQRGAILTPTAMESWENEKGARRSALHTGDSVYIMFGSDYLGRRPTGELDLATEQRLEGDLSSRLATLRTR